MKPNRRSARLVFLPFAGLAVVMLMISALWPGGLELTLTPVKGGRPILVAPLKPGECFTLHYYHSVEDSPIWEEHSVDGEGRIYVEEERYLKVGAGMGYLPGRGRLTQRGSFEVIEDMHSPTGDFILRVGSPGVAHTIIWRGTRTNLSALIPGRAVKFEARPVSLLYYCWRVFFPHPATPHRPPDG